jgi:hypothetical protein
MRDTQHTTSELTNCETFLFNCDVSGQQLTIEVMKIHQAARKVVNTKKSAAQKILGHRTNFAYTSKPVAKPFKIALQA